MASLVRWSPLSDLMSLHSAMDRLFGDTFGLGVTPGRTVAAVGEGYLPLDVYQTDREWIIRAAVPGGGPECRGGDVRWRGRPAEEREDPDHRRNQAARNSDQALATIEPPFRGGSVHRGRR